jgi:hypothetical protein
MMERHESDDDVAAALHALPREMTPPAHVGVRLASRVRSRARRPIWRAAIAACLVAAAFAAGRVTAPRIATAPPAGQKFALLLYGGGSGDDRAAEYGAWAVEVRRNGRQVSGERLADISMQAGMPLEGVEPVRGFFIVQARDAADAFELARRHPHAEVGTIVIRPIDTPD